jgi:hypothetical protein
VIVLPDPAVLAVGADPHTSADLLLPPAELYTPMGRLGLASQAMGAHGALVLGDLTGRPVQSSGCNGAVVWRTTCPIPSAEEGQWWRDDLASNEALYGLSITRTLALGGNHDTDMTGWFATWVDPLANEGIPAASRSTSERYEVQLQVGATVWSVLMVSDAPSDRSTGGRCDTLSGDPEDCSTEGEPAGEISPDQLAWLRWRLDRAEANGRPVILATHAPPPRTTVGSWPGEARAEVCPGVIFHGLHTRDAAQVPDRTDLDHIGADGLTPLQRADRWGGTIPYPHEDWAADLLADYPGVVVLWLAGHSHVRVPDLVFDGHGTVATIEGTTVVQVGGLTRQHCTTPGACFAQAARLELRGDGSWELERWALDPQWTPGSCPTAATLPAVIPGPFGNVPVLEGP